MPSYVERLSIDTPDSEKTKSVWSRKNEIHTPWSDQEDKLLISMYGKMDKKVLCNALGRTERAIRSRAAYLHLKTKEYKFWSAEEDEILRSRMEESSEKLAETLLRSPQSIKSRRRRLGVWK